MLVKVGPVSDGGDGRGDAAADGDDITTMPTWIQNFEDAFVTHWKPYGEHYFPLFQYKKPKTPKSQES